MVGVAMLVLGWGARRLELARRRRRVRRRVAGLLGHEMPSGAGGVPFAMPPGVRRLPARPVRRAGRGCWSAGSPGWCWG
ncbi:hypothetical protein ACFQ3Z_25770 [Streptomyces nogalater]